MKALFPLLVIAGLTAGSLTTHAAQYSLFNVAGGPGVDVLFANLNGSLMNNNGFVTMGYFPSTVTTADIDTIPELVTQLGSFTSLATAVPGTSAAFTAPGYLAEDPVSGGIITGANALIGRTLYAIVNNQANLAAAQLAGASGSNVFALFKVGVIADDVPFENSYVANPAGAQIILGQTGSFTGDLGLGYGHYTTLVAGLLTPPDPGPSGPEPSTAILGSLGMLGLLRRRR